MDFIVEEAFKINIYLDTNILVDYVQQENQSLVESLNYLAQSPFVILRSSHYVEFEFTEVRKRNEFCKIATGAYPPKDAHLQLAQRNWILKGIDYNSVKANVLKCISSDIEKISLGLAVNFDDHVLHDRLLKPTQDLCLNTKISREDSMVMVSCMFPKPDERLDFSVIFSNDKQYKVAFEENIEQIRTIFENMDLNLPDFLSAKELPSKNGNHDINQQTITDIKSFWDYIILGLIRKKQSENYLGHTIKPNYDLVYFDIEDKDKTLVDSSELVLISKDLTSYITIAKEFDYWNNVGKVDLPHKDAEDTTYSFKPSLESDILSIFQQKGNYLFYRDKLSDHGPEFSF